ncbi:hypothetical protein [Streptomyces sp. NPDC088725]|uniref:hypothetical protein n=1 Tax=Streptomyces sp. NPDC088725 TaxID=3365873 RepID=UPI0038223D10
MSGKSEGPRPPRASRSPYGGALLAPPVGPALPEDVRTSLSTALTNVLSAVLIVLLTVLTPLSAVAAFMKLEIGDSDRFVATTAPLASDPHVRAAITERVTDEVMKQIDAGPLQDQVRALLHDAVRSFTATPAFKTAWTAVSRATQNATEQALSSNHDNGRAVTINLATVTEQVKRQLVHEGVPLADRIPVQHTDITLLEPDGLGGWLDLVRDLQAAGIWPAVGTLVLALAAMLLPPRGHRRRAVVATGLAFAVGAVVLFVAISMGRGLTLDNLPSPSDRSAGRAVYDALTASLRTTAWSVLSAGIVLALAAVLTGPWVRHRRLY